MNTSPGKGGYRLFQVGEANVCLLDGMMSCDCRLYAALTRAKVFCIGCRSRNVELVVATATIECGECGMVTSVTAFRATMWTCEHIKQVQQSLDRQNAPAPSVKPDSRPAKPSLVEQVKAMKPSVVVGDGRRKFRPED